MEPRIAGFCEICYAWNEWLVTRVCWNKWTETVDIRKVCPECRKRFDLDAWGTSPLIGGDSYDRIRAEGENN